jgi:hypothetical protein
MEFDVNMSYAGRQLIPLLCATTAFFATAHISPAADPIRLESAGARFGVPANESSGDFHSVEAFLNLDLPWNWDLGHEWKLKSRSDASAGYLGESSLGAAIITLGPSLELGRNQLPLSLEGGVSPAYISRSEFDTKNFGINFQFISHAGLNFDISNRIRIGYRFQHMSNAGFSDRNPGLNLHLFGIGYRF